MFENIRCANQLADSEGTTTAVFEGEEVYGITCFFSDESRCRVISSLHVDRFGEARKTIWAHVYGPRMHGRYADHAEPI